MKTPSEMTTTTTTTIIASDESDDEDLENVMASIIMIQSMVKRYLARQKAKRRCLWYCWQLIDAKEEEEADSTAEEYGTLKERYTDLSLRQPGFRKKLSTIVGDVILPDNIHLRIPHRIKSMSLILKTKPKKGLHNDYKIGNIPLLTDELKNESNSSGRSLLNIQFIRKMIEEFRRDSILQYENVWFILKKVYPILKDLPNAVYVESNDAQGSTFNVVGDLHGQLDDLLTIFELAGEPNDKTRFLFNGDIVDRGEYSCECALLIFAMKVVFPDVVHINRGNHEAADINAVYGFEEEVVSKYDQPLFDLFSDIFACLPIAHVLNDACFVVHGGLSCQDFLIDDIQKINRFVINIPKIGLFRDLLWSDPMEESGRAASPRGTSCRFGPDVTKKFQEMNNMSLVVRSHECVDGCYFNHVLTIFSASNYCGTTGNQGAYLYIEPPFKVKVKTYMAEIKISDRNNNLEEIVVTKVLVRIAESRGQLDTYYKGIVKKGTLLSYQQWCDGLNQVLGLNLPYIMLGRMALFAKLGLKNSDSHIDYKKFLRRFLPTNSMMGSSLGSKLGKLLFHKRFELETLFRHFDADKSGAISAEEFKTGIRSLSEIEGDIDEKEIDTFLKEILKKPDDRISYNDFFQAFVLDNLITLEPFSPKPTSPPKKISRHRSHRGSLFDRFSTIGILSPGSRKRIVQKQMILAVKEKQAKSQKKDLHSEMKLIATEKAAKNHKKFLHSELIEETVKRTARKNKKNAETELLKKLTQNYKRATSQIQTTRRLEQTGLKKLPPTKEE